MLFDILSHKIPLIRSQSLSNPRGPARSAPDSTERSILPDCCVIGRFRRIDFGSDGGGGAAAVGFAANDGVMLGDWIVFAAIGRSLPWRERATPTSRLAAIRWPSVEPPG